MPAVLSTQCSTSKMMQRQLCTSANLANGHYSLDVLSGTRDRLARVISPRILTSVGHNPLASKSSFARIFSGAASSGSRSTLRRKGNCSPKGNWDLVGNVDKESAKAQTPDVKARSKSGAIQGDSKIKEEDGRQLVDELESAPVRVFVAESSRPGAGQGVFAREDIPSGKLVSEYVGTRLLGREARLEHETRLKELGLEDSYTIFVSGDCSIYGDREATPERGVACLINDHDCIMESDLTDLESAVDRYIEGIVADHNVDWYIYGNRLFARACTDIKGGQEVFTSYTTAWWLDRLRREILDRACDHLRLKWKNGSPREVDLSKTDVEAIKQEWALIRKIEKASADAVRWERDAYVKRDLMNFEERLYEIEPAPSHWEEDLEYGLAGCDWCLERQSKKHESAARVEQFSNQ